MLTSSAAGSVSMVNPTNTYTNNRKRGIVSSEIKGQNFDSAHFSAEDGEVAFRKEMIGRISQEVRTATTTGDIQKYRREIEEGTYTLDPMAIAGRILFFSED